MKLQRTVLIAALAVALCGLAGSASADQFSGVDGTITINGTVIAQTCSVNNGTGDKTVTLPNVLATALAGAGATTGDTGFTIEITGCDAALSTVDMDFSGTNINANGRLNNVATTSPATNVDVEILNSSSASIDLNDGGADTNQDGTETLASGAATFDYTARYYATAAATAGAVSSTVDFTLTYN